MKIHTLSLFILFFILGLFILNINSVSAANCSTGDLFSSVTGAPCGNTTTVVECSTGDFFSSVTGKPCGETVSTPFCVLPNFQVGSKGENVRAFQAELNTQGASLKVDGSYGPKTEAAMLIYCKKYPYPYPNPSSVVISGVKGPQSLNVNEQGTWTVTAYNKYGGNLSYSVNWGDEIYAMPMANSLKSSSAQQSATFTHSYLQAGTYTPTFTVSSENTIQCIQAPCTSNAGNAQTSLSVKVGDLTGPFSISMLSPNGGETWIKGTTQTITWKDNNNISTHEIKLASYYSPCTSNICPMYAYRMPYTIANTQGSSYSWSVGKTLDNNIVPEGAYTMEVCQTGTTTCDSSDSYFKIINGITTIQVPTISSLSPTSGYVGAQVTIYGSGFTSTNNSIKFGGGYINGLNSSGTTITFIVPDGLSPCAPSATICPMYYMIVTPGGSYPISVTNSNGTSNAVNFTVTSQ